MINSDLNISESLKVNIVKNLIEPSYKTEIEGMIKGKRCWKITGHIFETISKIFVALGCIFSFASGYYSNTELSFVAGCVSTVSLAMIQISTFAYKENKRQVYELNILLQKLNIDTIPDTNIDTDKDSE